MKPRRDRVGVLGNIAILERELGTVAYRLAKLDAAGEGEALRSATERRDLLARHASLVSLLDSERARLEAGRADRTAAE